MTPPSNKQTRKAAETTARERAAALKAQAAREERRHKLMMRGGVGLVVAATVGILVVIGINSNKSPSQKLTGDLPNVAPNGGTGAPPWAAPTNTAERVALAGLTILPNETLDRHDHVHLDIFIDGKAVPLPAYIGIAGGAQSTGFAPLHTHDTSGIVHIEAADAGARFALGQVFNEWNVLLTPTQIGGFKNGGDKTLTFYVNGKVLTTDPSKLELKAHQEIVIVYGTAAENKTVTVPASYKWTGGL